MLIIDWESIAIPIHQVVLGLVPIPDVVFSSYPLSRLVLVILISILNLCNFALGLSLYFDLGSFFFSSVHGNHLSFTISRLIALGSSLFPFRLLSFSLWFDRLPSRESLWTKTSRFLKDSSLFFVVLHN